MKLYRDSPAKKWNVILVVSIASRGHLGGIFHVIIIQVLLGSSHSWRPLPKEGFRCVPNSGTEWLILQSVWEFSLGSKSGSPAMTFWSKTLPATFFFRKHGSTQRLRNGSHPINKGEASEFREDKIDISDVWKRSLSETPSPTCRACFRYVLTRTPAEELKFLHWFTSFSIPCVSSTYNIRCKEGRHCFQRWCITWTG